MPPYFYVIKEITFWGIPVVILAGIYISYKANKIEKQEDELNKINADDGD